MRRHFLFIWYMETIYKSKMKVLMLLVGFDVNLHNVTDLQLSVSVVFDKTKKLSNKLLTKRG